MRDRSLWAGLLLVGLVVPLTSCTSSPSLTSISVTPTTMTFGGAGLTTQLTAMGSYTHPGHPAELKDITSQVTWTSATPGCVTVSATGLITSQNAVCSNILVTASAPGFGGDITGTMTVNVTASGGGGGSADITSVSIIPSAQTVVSLNETSQFIAIGKDAAGDSVDVTDVSTWSSSSPSVASITNSGLATALGAGTTTITAEYKNADGTVATGTATFTVSPSGSPEPLVALSIVPSAQTALAINQTVQYIAIGTTGNGTTVDLTTTATWTATNVAVATIGANTGLATSVGAGTTAIVAEAQNPDGSIVTGTASLTVTLPTVQENLVSLSIVPSSETVVVGQSAQFIAIATTNTGTTEDVTAQTKWNSSVGAVATMSANGPTGGLATSKAAGATAITAEASNTDGTVVTGTATLTVAAATSSPEPYVSLAIVPESQTASSKLEQAQFIAIGTTPTGTTVDLTNSPNIVWSSSDQTVATIVSTNGLATAQASGVAAIVARYTNPADSTVVTGIATFTVSISAPQEPLISVTVVPSTASVLSLNETTQFIALGTYASAPFLRDLTTTATWSSSDTKVATINSTGLATGLNQGSTAIIATAKNTDGTVVTGAASFNETATGTGVTVSTLTVTLNGSGAANGVVTAPAPGTLSPLVLNCSAATPAECTQTFALGAQVTLTAPAPPSGTTFGGFSTNCALIGSLDPTGSNSCKVTLTDNSTVAAIFY